jgi:hypothetical protein
MLRPIFQIGCGLAAAAFWDCFSCWNSSRRHQIQPAAIKSTEACQPGGFRTGSGMTVLRY